MIKAAFALRAGSGIAAAIACGWPLDTGLSNYPPRIGYRSRRAHA